MTKTEAKASKIKMLTNQIEDGINSIYKSENYRKWLNTCARFHKYSFNNTILIMMQRPTATRVAGYKTWEKLNRHVKKGEKGISILAPAQHKIVLKKNDDNNNDTQDDDIVKYFTTFHPVSVFDESQTEGEELPTIYHGKVDGTVENYNAMLDAIKKIVNPQVRVRFDEIKDDTDGYYNNVSKEIVIKSGMNQAKTISTLIHEVAHSRMHSGKEAMILTKKQKETEAESVAYIVSSYFGIDTKESSSEYIAGWENNKDNKLFKESLSKISKTASEMIDDIEKNMK